MSLIKLGGSVITVKDRALTPNIKAIEGLSRVLAKLGDSVIISTRWRFIWSLLVSEI